MYLPVSIEILVIAIFFALLALAAFRDITRYTIPNSVNLAIVSLYPAYVLGSTAAVDWVGGITVALIVFAIGVALFARGMLGGGDVKLMVAVSLWAGPGSIAEFVVVMSVAGAVMALFLLSPLRVGLALAFDRAGNEHARDAVLARVLPYGLAIAAGGFVVGARLPALLQA